MFNYNNYKVVLVGCTRNSGAYIRGHLDKLYQLTAHFKDFKMVIYENDSSDNTSDQLRLFQGAHPPGQIQLILEPNTRGPRANILTHGRNSLLQFVQKNYQEYDYMLVSDMDNVLIDFQAGQIAQFFQHDPAKWDVLTASCRGGPYYDIWALRVGRGVWDAGIHGTIWPAPLEHDCWREQRGGLSPQQCIKQYQTYIPESTVLIETDSAFGGFGIYKLSKLANCRYECWNANRTTTHCEHVAFHRDIKQKNGGRIFICPSFQLQCPREHIV